MSDRLAAQLDFLTEIDKLKSVLRASPLADGSRRENSGEHSWHIAMHALVLADHADPDVSIDRVIRMLLVHDIVEIDAGDVPIHLDVDPAAQEAAERAAAARLFGLLPPDLGAELAALWEEFEAGETPDAAFARAVDRVQPLLLNLAAGGGTWIDYEVSLEQTETRAGAPIAQAAPRLWAHVRAMIAPWFERRG
ncbi:MAG: HD domain-containing protein [Deinococcus-Thermus bacterium]|nr:HD domain-containing protein [Deinococcota bacterium]